ncbi:GGDEF domain-containing protein [Rhodanobacter sp. C05]|nr:GGDEF domain-containing protein [Rhodanobacter sp. C05]
MGKRCWAYFAGWTLLIIFHVGTAAAAVPTASDPAQLLRQADTLKTTNHAEFAALIHKLGEDTAKLSSEQQLYLRYLNAWEIAYRGDYGGAIPLLNTVIDKSTDATLRFRAGATVVNMLGIVSRYEEAFERLSQLLDQLPQVTDKVALTQGLSVVAQLYIEAGQYDLAMSYADQLIRESPTSDSVCRGRYLNLEAFFRSNKLEAPGKQFQDGIDACGESVFANGIRYFVASLDIQQGRPVDAIKLLQKNYVEVQRAHYPPLIAEFNASLAQAYWKEGDLALSQQFALDTVNNSIKGEYTESLTIAYELLYLIAQKQGDMGTALAYHEKYMAADKGYLTVISAKALAYQTVKQQVLAKKLQIETLNKQNQILQLQEKLAKKAAVTSRLYIILLLVVLASIAMWTYRIKRSQLSFMRLARRDGLTGIFNRQHFVSEAELQLQYCRKSSRDACLVLIDLDHFKAVNDNHGHAVGDRVLKRAVETCQTHLRSTDIFGRLGGEEFGILLPECTLELALGRAEQIRQAIATAASGEEVPGVPVSASFGIASVIHSGYELRQLLIHADEALYQAKREGRNRVSVSVSDTQEACLKTG